MLKNAIFIAATGQNVGKTTLCLGILAGLRKRYQRIGFIKPVGQQHVKINPQTMVDKDAVLFKQHFGLSTEWSDMSPVIIPPGFTRDYIDQKISEDHLIANIKTSYEKIFSTHDYTVVEGTGHVGVGSIVGLNNAKVASILGLDMVIIASGGLGSSYDELALNFAMCEKYGVKVRGVILNRVLDHKREMIIDYFSRALEKWKIPLIGCVPFNAFLSSPTMNDFESLFTTNLLSGKAHHYRHFRQFRLVAGSLEAYLEEFVEDDLVITPATREDIIMATLERSKGGMILTGRHPINPELLKKVQEVDIPTLYAPLCSYDVMKKIGSYVAKIQKEDTEKVERAIEVVEKNIQFNALCKHPLPA